MTNYRGTNVQYTLDKEKIQVHVLPIAIVQKQSHSHHILLNKLVQSKKKAQNSLLHFHIQLSKNKNKRVLTNS